MNRHLVFVQGGTGNGQLRTGRWTSSSVRRLKLVDLFKGRGYRFLIKSEVLSDRLRARTPSCFSLDIYIEIKRGWINFGMIVISIRELLVRNTCSPGLSVINYMCTET